MAINPDVANFLINKFRKKTDLSGNPGINEGTGIPLMSAPPSPLPDNSSKSYLLAAALAGLGDSISAYGGNEKPNYLGNVLQQKTASDQKSEERRNKAIEYVLKEKELQRKKEEDASQKGTEEKRLEQGEKRLQLMEDLGLRGLESKEGLMKEKRDQQDETRIQRIRENLASSEPYKRLNQIRNATGNLREAVLNPGAFGDLTILYDTMTMVDPDSVVREGDQRLFQSTSNVPSRIANNLNRLVTGETLTKEQRESILSYANLRLKTAKQIYKTHAGPALKQAGRLSLPLEEIDPAYYFDEDGMAPDNESSKSMDDEAKSIKRRKRIMKLREKAGK